MITLTQSYTPFGEVLTSTGEGQTDYAFTGEMFDPETGLVYLRARYYGVGDGRFVSRDSFGGFYQQPSSLNSYTYSYSNPIILTDPSGNNPIITQCLIAIGALSAIDTALPVGDAVGIAYCIALATGIITIAETPVLIKNVIETIEDIDIYCPPNTITWEYLLDNVASDPSQEPTPQPIPEPKIDIFPPLPTNTPAPKHYFYFRDVGDYPIPGREIIRIVQDLDYYNYPGMHGAIGQLNAMDKLVNQTGGEWAIYPLMGRKFESERAIYYAREKMLVNMNVTSAGYDLTVSNFGTITSIELKWTLNPLGEPIIKSVAEKSKLHPSGSYLLESNKLDNNSKISLRANGGIELPNNYP